MFKIILIILIPLGLYIFYYVILSKVKNYFDKSSILIVRCIKPSNIIFSLAGIIGIFVVLFLFYRSYKVSIVVSSIGLLAPKLFEQSKEKRRIREYKIQFREALYNLSTLLEVGMSLENSFRESIENLTLVFGEKANIVQEFRCIVGKLDINKSMDMCLIDFKVSMGIDDVDTFVDMLLICRKKGGNIVELLKGCNLIISEKIRIEEEIYTMLSEKRFEQYILLGIPIGLMIILSITSQDFIEPLFITIQGRAAVTISLGLIALSYFISKKIMNIEV